MIYLRKKCNDIVLECDNIQIIKEVKEFLTFYKKGYRFTPSFQCGRWDGKKSLFDSSNRSFPFGLIYDVLTFLKDEKIKTVVDPEVKNLFVGTDKEPIYDLKHKPYDYQDDAIRIMLKSSSCVIKSPTGSGKSLIIAYVLNNLLNWGLIRSGIIVVPTKGLIKQFHSDLIDYGIDDSLIGEVHSTSKEFDKSIVISTWQSLSNKIGAINAFDCVIIDEAHGSKADRLFNILKYADNVTFKYGVTGTLPEDKLELMQVKSYLGPVLKEITNNYIAEKGHISRCNIKMINLHYNNIVIPRNTEYADIRDIVFKHPFRINFISEIAAKCTKTLLILVEKIEDEGEYLFNHLNTLGLDKEIVFLHGSVDTNLIEKYRKQAEYDDKLIIIATYGIFSQGINIKSLQYIVKAVSYRSKIRVLQSIGRALRTHVDKGDGAYIFDICDDIKVFKKQKSQRKRFYKTEEFDIEEISITENENMCFDEFFTKEIAPNDLFQL